MKTITPALSALTLVSALAVLGSTACSNVEDDVGSDTGAITADGGAAALGPIGLSDVPKPTSHVPPAIDEIWHAMRGEAAARLQPGCEPARYSPPAGTAYRGIVIMLHGFSACPQQYDVLGPQMAKAGYEVFVPLHPGHGAYPKVDSPRVDNTDFVPTAAGGWGPTVARINEIAGLAQGEKVLIGLSQGSNLALRALETAPALYDKVVVMAPKLQNESSWLNGIFTNDIHVLGIDDFILGLRSGWKQCEADSVPNGSRAGFCNFENRNAVAMFDFGKIVVDTSATLAQKGVRPKAAVQFVLSHADDGVCNQASLQVRSNFKAAGGDAKLCFMPKGVPHSMFSRYDKPQDKPWVPGLFNAIEQFVVKGTPIGSALPDCQSDG